MLIRSLAPAKLILSGEHSVVYGKPAVAMAINRFVETSIGWSSDSRAVNFHLSNFNYNSAVTLQELRNLKQRIQFNYNKFLNDNLVISEVLPTPFELAQYVVIYILDEFNIVLPHGLKTEIKSNIPIGFGMGSSAAVIISLLYVLNKFFELNMYCNNYLQIGGEIENLQHGHSSGLDICLSVCGGCVRFENGTAQPMPMPKIPFYFIDTGKSKMATGECVSVAAKHFRENKKLADEFAAVTNEFGQALLASDFKKLKECIRNNHKLLTVLEVVPKRVQNFINEIEKLGGSGKICGAGAGAGENAGIVMVLGQQEDILPLVKKYGYRFFSVRGNIDGAEII